MEQGPKPTHFRRGVNVLLRLDNGSLIGYPAHLGFQGSSRLSQQPVCLSVEQVYQAGRLDEGVVERMERIVQDLRQLTPDLPQRKSLGKRPVHEPDQPEHSRKHRPASCATEAVVAPMKSAPEQYIGVQANKGPVDSQIDELFESSPSTSYGHFDVPDAVNEVNYYQEQHEARDSQHAHGQGKGKGLLSRDRGDDGGNAPPHGVGRGKGLVGSQGMGKGLFVPTGTTPPATNAHHLNADDEWDDIEHETANTMKADELEDMDVDVQRSWSPGSLQRPRARPRVVMMSPEGEDEDGDLPPFKRQTGNSRSAVPVQQKSNPSQPKPVVQPAVSKSSAVPSSVKQPSNIRPQASVAAKPPAPAARPPPVAKAAPPTLAAPTPKAPAAKPAPLSAKPLSTSPPSALPTVASRTGKIVKDSPRDFSAKHAEPSPVAPGGSGGKHRYVSLNSEVAAAPPQKPAATAAVTTPTKPAAVPRAAVAEPHTHVAAPSFSPLKEQGSGQLVVSHDYYDVCKDIVKKMHKHLGRRWYVFANKPDERDCPNYYNLIKQPMYMALIEEKLKRRAYKSPGEYAADMRLVWSNCASYNLPETEVFRMGAKASARFEELWDQSGLDISPLGHARVVNPASAHAPIAARSAAPSDRKPPVPAQAAPVARAPASAGPQKPGAARPAAPPAPAAARSTAPTAAAPRKAAEAAAPQRRPSAGAAAKPKRPEPAPAAAAPRAAPSAPPPASRAGAAAAAKPPPPAAARPAASPPAKGPAPKRAREDAAVPAAKVAKVAEAPPQAYSTARLEDLLSKISELSEDPSREADYNSIMEVIQQDDLFRDIKEGESEVELELDKLSHSTLRALEAGLKRLSR